MWFPGLFSVVPLFIAVILPVVAFAALVVAHWFGFTAPDIPETVQNSLLNIVMVGVGGYVVGRSGENS